MKKLLLIPVLAFAILLTGCGSDNQTSNVKDNTSKDETSENVEEKKDEVKESVTKENTSKKTEDEKEDVKAAVSDTIKITSIKAGDTMVSPILLEGTADIESGVVIAELRKTDHTITSNKVSASVRDGKFRISKFWFEFNNTKEGFVAVYDKENPENIVEIPVKFQTVK